jgi:hypothetical protein
VNDLAAAPQSRRKRGAPKKLVDGEACKVYLDRTSRRRAEILGAGNISEGIRKALEMAVNRGGQE